MYDIIVQVTQKSTGVFLLLFETFQSCLPTFFPIGTMEGNVKKKKEFGKNVFIVNQKI